jgi:hypothetical protein
MNNGNILKDWNDFAGTTMIVYLKLQRDCTPKNGNINKKQNDIVVYIPAKKKEKTNRCIKKVEINE